MVGVDIESCREDSRLHDLMHLQMLRMAHLSCRPPQAGQRPPSQAGANLSNQRAAQAASRKLPDILHRFLHLIRITLLSHLAFKSIEKAKTVELMA